MGAYGEFSPSNTKEIQIGIVEGEVNYDSSCWPISPMAFE